jgi:hypothetical protein
MFSDTILMLYRTETVALGTLYSRLCVLAQSHDVIQRCSVSIGHEAAINGWKVQPNKYNKSGKNLLPADFGHVTVFCDRTEL